MTEPDTVHQFSWLNTTFAYPAVILDHSSWISYTWSNGKLSVTFLSEEAYNRASGEWTEEIILVANAEGCRQSDSDSCYLSVTELEFDSKSSSCHVSCEVLTLKEVMSSVKNSWGRYLPNGKPNMLDGCMSLFDSVLSKYLPFPSTGAISGSRKTGPARPLKTVVSTTVKPSKSLYPGGSASSSGYQSGASSATHSGGEFYQETTTTAAPLITTPPQVTTSKGLSEVSSSLSSYFSSLAASNYTRSSSSVSTGYTPSGVPSAGDSSSAVYSSSALYPVGAGNSSSIVYASAGYTSSHSPTTANDFSSTGYRTSSAAYPSSSAGNFSAPTTPTNSTSNSTVLNSPSGCVRGTDPIFGLPTTCIGPDFDLDLDAINGFLTLSATDFAALIDFFPGLITSKSDMSYREKSTNRSKPEASQRSRQIYRNAADTSTLNANTTKRQAPWSQYIARLLPPYRVS